MAQRDKIQLEIEFITDSAKRMAATINETKALNRELQNAATKGGDMEKAIQKVADESKKLAGINLKDVMPSQLIDRAKQLKDAMKWIPETHPQRAQMEADLRAVNTQLADMNGKTKGVTAAMDGLRVQGAGAGGVLSQAFAFFAGGGILSVVETLIGGLVNVGKSALKASADMETLKTTVEVFLGSGAAATKFLRDIQKFAADTPFEFPQLAEAGKKLLTFGYSGDEAMKLIKRLGEVSSAAQVPIDELAGIIGKAKLGQKIQGEELNQLADRGINIFPELAKVLNTTESQIKKLGSEGKISYQDLEKAIELATDKGGKFNGLMEKQSQTFSGLMSTLSDNFGQFMQTLVGGMGGSLKPILKGISDFFGQLTDLLRDGKQPAGEYAAVIEFVARGLKNLGNAFGIVWEVAKIVVAVFIEVVKEIARVSNRINELTNWFVNLAAEAKKIPILAALFKPILDAIGLVSDLLSNASATFAGFRAAAAQAITNVQTYFKALIIDAEIVGAKISSALSFNEQTKKQAAELVASREAQKAAMFKTGKTVEQAYTEGRNAAIATQNKVEAETAAKKVVAQKAAQEIDQKAAEKAAQDRLKKLKDDQDLAIRQAENYYAKELLANDIALLKKQKTESDAARDELRLNDEKYTKLIELQTKYLSFYKKGSEEYLKTEGEILKLEKSRLEITAQLNRPTATETAALPTIRAQSQGIVSQTGGAANAAQTQAQVEMSIVRSKFANLLMSELEFNMRVAEIRKTAADARVDALIAQNATETGEYKKALKEKNDADQNFETTKTDNAKRTTELQNALEAQKLGALRDSFAVAAELLGADEASRKKHASAIKAFQIGQTWISAYSEIAGIWENANKNPINALVPGWGPIFAGIQTALSIGRATASTQKIASQKFARGGFTGPGMNMIDDTGFRVAGVVHEGEYVIPKSLVENPQFAPTLSSLELARVGGYAQGGFVATPNFNYNVTMPLESVFERYLAKIDTWQANLGAQVILTDLEQKQYEYDRLKNNASY
jgi:tape measure domain-containing protein